jgi:hypothetical protein
MLETPSNVGSNIGPNIWDKYVRQLVRRMYLLECLIQKVWYKRLSGLSRVGDSWKMQTLQLQPQMQISPFKGYGAEKGIQT